MVLRRRRGDWGGDLRHAEDDARHTARRAAVSMASAALAAHDGLTWGHSDDVVSLCEALADHFELDYDQRTRLLVAAELHDIGKVAVPSTILDKPGALDHDEWKVMHEHTISGERILNSVPELCEVAHIVRHSHERWDGGGYPDGLAGEEIPLESRIVFCADAFHAVRSDRPYRAGRAAREALREVRLHAGTQFDPRVVDALEAIADDLKRSPAKRVTAMTDSVRSRRLVVLLLTLVVGGSAFAVPGSPLRGLFGGGEEAAEAATCQPAPCLPAQFGSMAELPPAGQVAGAGALAADGLGSRGADGKRAAKKGSPRERSNRRSAGRRTGRGGAGSGAGVGSPATRPAGQGDRSGAGAGGPGSVGTDGGEAGVPNASRPVQRPPRPSSPGRSGEAPRRPAKPGKPTGPGPGRSNEAPGKPTGPGKFGNGQKSK